MNELVGAAYVTAVFVAFVCIMQRHTLAFALSATVAAGAGIVLAEPFPVANPAYAALLRDTRTWIPAALVCTKQGRGVPFATLAFAQPPVQDDPLGCLKTPAAATVSPARNIVAAPGRTMLAALPRA